MSIKSGPVRKVLASLICSLLVTVYPAVAQTFEIGGQPSAQSKNPSKDKRPPDTSTGIGWGSSIEVGRIARAAEDSLRRGNYAAAANYAQRAAHAAPQNARFWFLLGYTSRLAGRYQGSEDAYRRGLQLEPGSNEGLSGLAQTYIKLGRANEAKRLLNQVIARKPRQTDLLVAGELYLQTDELQKGISLLQRAESMQPSSHAELLLAMGYMKLKQPAKAKQLLDKAKARSPRNTAIFRAVANYYREARDFDSAIATLKSAPQQTPDVLADLGYSYELARKHKEAAEAYARAANAAPKQAKIQLSAAQAYLRTGELDKARQFIARAAAVEPNHYRLHATRGLLAKVERRIRDAIAAYAAAIQALPEAVPEGLLYPIYLRMNLAELYREAGDKTAANREIAAAEDAINRLQVEGTAKAEFLRVRASIRAQGEDFRGAENDLTEALKLDPGSSAILLQYGNLLWRTKRQQEAKKVFQAVLTNDKSNRYALEALGYLAREAGDVKLAEQFFNRLAVAHPDDHVPHLALGDLFTQVRQFDKADASYQKAYELAPRNPLVIASATNAAIDARKFKLADEWIARAEGAMNDDPRVMRERERVLFHHGKYLESANLGRRVVQLLPENRDASVYLGYSLYNLGRYDEVLALVTRYEKVLPREANFPLLAGHVHKQTQLLHQAVDDYTRAIERDPRMVEAFVNRGYVLNDLQNAEAALQDFEHALKLSPQNGVVHLGMAFSHLELHNGKLALEHAEKAAQRLGVTAPIHLARATAYRQQRMLSNAEKEYRAAIKLSPNEPTLQLALADTLYHLRRYPDAITALNTALALLPEDAYIYSKLAHAYARMGRRDETMRYISAAEQQSADEADVLLSTGEALLWLGEEDAAMERFERALSAPDANRVDARLAIARVFVRDGNWDDARQQVALAFAESRIGEAPPVTIDNVVEAANMFLRMHDFELAEKYFEGARELGAADQVVGIGLANTYLAMGNSGSAEAELARLGSPADYGENYDYQLAIGQVYRQRQDNISAMNAFARANMLAYERDDIAERRLHETADDVGHTFGRHFSLQSDFAVTPIFEPTTIYEVDADLLNARDPAVAPPPRSSIEYRWTNAYRVFTEKLPPISGFLQLRNARGRISQPSEARIIDRNTYDYVVNGALNPVLRLGRNFIGFNVGLQYTWRRDSASPVEISENLFRQFAYFYTNSFGNWISARGMVFHEGGGFTRRNLNSRDTGASLDFTVGRPWGSTALITGWSARDLQFDPLVREFFHTSTYVGLQQKFGQKVRVSLAGEYLRTWRVQDDTFAISQAARPAFEFDFRPNNRWTAHAEVAYSRGMGNRLYDNVQSGFYISYVKPLRRTVADGTGQVPVEYPLRLSIGVQQEKFFNFPGRDQMHMRPIIRLTLF
jgi:tetratricopeptide (TPR) repeat protein